MSGLSGASAAPGGARLGGMKLQDPWSNSQGSDMQTWQVLPSTSSVWCFATYARNSER
eukprot:CAMPEP_0204081024 /NCGR_PEP_ID=MMETSP0360-20130528/174852_1 /ASSEMBLY_ACC=CAM_ASM_000342 /TAXON_ID=268821 /ORGANISM="Scrippsiella Hangoei, Strain SHTV-5" /LENGTH=57 /DNA_ID=CAMNT_0051029833 /DNA_START=82 /DNA_END=252 /DNA_ORIENTATION=-